LAPQAIAYHASSVPNGVCRRVEITRISSPFSPRFEAFIRDFVLVLSRMTVLVLDCN